jgi:hypothetical protein
VDSVLFGRVAAFRFGVPAAVLAVTAALLFMLAGAGSAAAAPLSVSPGAAVPAAMRFDGVVPAVKAKWPVFADVPEACFVVVDRAEFGAAVRVDAASGRGCAPWKAFVSPASGSYRPVEAVPVGVGARLSWSVSRLAPVSCVVWWNGRCVSWGS